MASQASVVDGVFAASQKIGITRVTFLAYVLPPFVCQYSMGVLVQLDGTRFYRLAFLPVTIWLAWRATLVDLSGGDPTKAQMNSALIVECYPFCISYPLIGLSQTQMCSLSTRSAVWALARTRYQRYSPEIGRSKSDSEGVCTACWNTWDLLINPRGIGWNWPRALFVPKPAFETNSHVLFVLLSAVGVAFHALAFDTCVQIIRVLSPETFGSLKGGSLFDQSLPPTLQLSRSVLISILAASSAYFALEYSYQLLAIVCIILFHQHPSQWPPLFDSPWLSTSLSELWGHRWHQMMRDMLLTLGGQPFSHLFGRLGGLFGAFLVSGIFHDIELRSSGGGGNTLVVVCFWTMNGVGVILERVWKQTTGRSVGGIWGRIWMVGWLALWGVPTVNEYAKAGRFASLTLPGRLEPSLTLFRAFYRG